MPKMNVVKPEMNPTEAINAIFQSYGAWVMVWPGKHWRGDDSFLPVWFVDFVFEAHRAEWAGMGAEWFIRFSEEVVDSDLQIIQALMDWEERLDIWMSLNG